MGSILVENNQLALEDMVPMDRNPAEDIDDTQEVDNPNMFFPFENSHADHMNLLSSAHAPRVEKGTYDA
jgi:hypothetical protein